jgi:hypothetical protein
VADIFFENAPAGSVESISKVTDFYNCVGWAVHRQDEVIWPDEDEQMRWPVHVPRHETIDAFEQFFRVLGFERCANTDFEVGFEKVAIYARDGATKHVARQYASGRWKGFWTSKLGPAADVRHRAAEVIQGKLYGAVTLNMRRRFDGKPPRLPAMHPARPRLVHPTGRPLIR